MFEIGLTGLENSDLDASQLLLTTIAPDYRLQWPNPNALLC